MQRYLVILFGLGLLILAACQSNTNAPQTQVLPTRIPSVTPEYNNFEDAQQVALSFLHFWEQSDFESMYSLLSSNSRDATPFESFKRSYDNAYNEMRLVHLTIAPLAIARLNARVMTFSYDATFTSNVVGAFTDANREMQLVLDERVEQWRVAWSLADIFAGLANGGELRMDVFPPRRASIYDVNGQILADMGGEVITIRLVRQAIPDLEACTNTLAGALSLTQDAVTTRLENNAPDWLAEIGFIERQAYYEWGALLEQRCGATFDNQPTRRYLEGDLAPYVLGTVGYPTVDEIEAIEQAGFLQDSIIGRSGVEKNWDPTLRGKPGGQLILVSADGDSEVLLAESGTQPSQSVYLTLDRDLQRTALDIFERAYANVIAESSKGASAVVMEVNTGAVRAMVSYPTYDGNALAPFPVMGRRAAAAIVADLESDPRNPLLNRAAQGRYPTGSSMKVITAIAALDSGVYTFDERYTSTGVWNRDIPRTDWLGGGHGTINLSDALTHSCNTCFYEVGYRLNEVDPYLLPSYMNKFGIGMPTGMIDIETSSGFVGTPDTKSLIVPDEGPWSFSNTVDMAIGQGFLEVSPLQMARAYAAVANDGTLYRPQLVERVALLDEDSYHMTPDGTVLDVDHDVLEYVRGGMCKVTTASYGTAEFVFYNSPLQDIGVCGKTGTATAGVGDVLSHAWFIGYAPRENPEIVVAVMVENSGEGSEVAAPIVRDIMEYYFFG